MHTLEMFEPDCLAVMPGGPFDKPLRKSAKLTGGMIAHQKSPIGGVLEIKDRNVGPRVDLPDLRVNDVVHAKDKCTGGCVRREKHRVSLRQNYHRFPSKPAQH